MKIKAQQNYVLIGDQLVSGHRDQVGLALPLNGALARELGEEVLPILRDLSGPGGLSGALRRVSQFRVGELGQEPTFLVILGTEDARANPQPEEWRTAYLSLIRLLQSHGGPILLAIPPPLLKDRSQVRGWAKEARRWSAKVPAAAAQEAVASLPAYPDVAVVHVPPDVDRADNVWLSPLGVRQVSDYLAPGLVSLQCGHQSVNLAS